MNRYPSTESIPEPEAQAIHDLLCSLLDVIQFEVDGRLVEIDGFRLKDCEASFPLADTSTPG